MVDASVRLEAFPFPTMFARLSMKISVSLVRLTALDLDPADTAIFKCKTGIKGKFLNAVWSHLNRRESVVFTFSRRLKVTCDVTLS